MRDTRSLVFAPLALALLIAACADSQPEAAVASPPAASPPGVAQGAADSTDQAEPADAQVGMDAPGAELPDVALRPAFSVCMQSAGGATPAMQDCIAQEYRHQDDRLNAAYRSARAALPAAEAKALLDAQRAWIARRDGECTWDAASEGQGQRLAANDCLLRMTALRAAELEAIATGAAPAAGGSAPGAASIPGSRAGSSAASGAASGAESRADAAADSEGRLRLMLGDAGVRVDAEDCNAETASLQRCSGGARVSVTSGGVTRELRVDSLYLNSRTTAYRGPLDDPADRAGRSIVIADIDRDGREDIALWTGTRGANGAASYDVYLASAAGYRRDAALSALTEGANGLFTLDDGRLVRMSKSGCCLHTTARYEWRDGRPLLVEEVVEDATAGRASPVVTTRRRIDGRMQTVDP